MATLKKVKIVDKAGRVNLSLKETTRIALEQHRLYLEGAHDLPYTSSEIVEQVLVAWFEQDREFKAYVEGLTEKQKAEILKGVKTAEKTDDKPAPVQVQTRPAYGSPTTN